MYAPIVIFCYRRKITALINSLLKNRETSSSDLFIYSDNFKSELDKQDVLDVRKSIKNIKGFRSIKIYESNKNLGLASSIIDGVTSVFNNFDKAIILEDDLIVSEFFLNFMNKSLNFYKGNKNIWSISGYSPPLSCLNKYQDEVYLSLRSSSWGWATWADRWNKVDWLIKDFKKLKKNKIKQFELGGNDLFKMLELHYLGKINSWAIIWCYSHFRYSAYSVCPKISMTKNTGFNDGFETNTSGNDSKWKVNLATKKVKEFNVSLNHKIIKNFKEYKDLSTFTKIGYFLKKYGGYRIAKFFLKMF